MTYYDHADRPLEVHAPNSPIVKYQYDAKGRQIVSGTFAGAEVARTQTVYDEDDRAIATIRFERKAGSPSGDLALYAVKSYTYTWYDDTGKVQASADFGTNNPNNTFVSGSAPLDTTESSGNYWSSRPADVDETGNVTVCQNGKFGPQVQVTCYAYDEAGRQAAVFNPNGTVTEYQYDGLGRVLMTTENAREGDPAQAAAVRQTAYKYDDKGRLVAMAGMGLQDGYHPLGWSEIVWDANDPSVERTSFTYGAEVLDKGGNVISQHNGWIKEVHYPDPATGAPNATPSLTFQYYSDGSVASREDEKGNRFVYHYDEQGRLEQTDVAGERWYNDPTPRYAPPPSIKSILYTYTPDGLLDTVTAYDGENGGGNILSQNHFHYDALRHLAVEYQSHGAAVVEGTTPAVEYAWASSPQGTGTFNFDRLQRIYYPIRPESGRREVGFHYGNDTDDADSRLNRVTEIWDTAIHPSQAVAAYEYMGTSRRVGLTLGNVITQSVVDANGNGIGLDRYGRITNLQYMNGANTVHQYEYAYDISGNRTQARVIQAPVGSTTHDNDRSYLYTYDHLQRLINAHMGRIGLDEEENLIIVPDDPDVALRREMKWSLDALGNWTGTPFPENPQYPPPGLRRKDYLDGSETPSTSTSIKHTTDAFNEITAIKTGTVTQPVLNDPAGNLIFDGTYIYQYDPWNRLVEVNQVGSLVYDPANPTTDDFDDDGKIQPGEGHEIGDLVVRFQYDGLGRLMLVEKVHSGSPPNPSFTKEHYYYDGVRRLQEVVQTPGTPNDTFATQHEYVYGPDYVDEFIVETQRDSGGNQQAFYILQDANFNVMALLDSQGAVVEQYQWEPYGLPATVDVMADPRPSNSIGHQGLFFYRFDASGGFAPSVQGLYFNRNRWFSPSLGRFTSRDPNETAQLILSAELTNAEAFMIVAGAFSAGGHFGSGMNLYGYLQGNPITGADPLGLYDPLEEADAIIAGMAAEKAAAAHHAFAMIGRMAQITATMAMQGLISAIFPPYGLYLCIDGAASAMEDMLFNGLSWNNAAMLGLNVLGARAAFGASMAQMQRIGASVRRAYSSIGGQYAQGGMRGSGFSLGMRETSVRNPLVRLGSFSIRDWHGYPAGVPRPGGPFVLLEGAEYQAARDAADAANAALRRANPAKYNGKQIHEIHPVKFGGDPVDPANKIALDHPVHVQYSNFWRRIQDSVR